MKSNHLRPALKAPELDSRRAIFGMLVMFLSMGLSKEAMGGGSDISCHRGVSSRGTHVQPVALPFREITTRTQESPRFLCILQQGECRL